MYLELLLRLEQTDARHALEIPVRAECLGSAHTCLNHHFKRHGEGYVQIVSKINPPRLYVSRGPKWHQTGRLSLPLEEEEESVS